MIYRFGNRKSTFSLLYKKNSLDAATAVFPKCTNNLSNYTTEYHL